MVSLSVESKPASVPTVTSGHHAPPREPTGAGKFSAPTWAGPGKETSGRDNQPLGPTVPASVTEYFLFPPSEGIFICKVSQ